MKFYKDGHTEINFNPRSREGSDKSSQSLSNAVNQISIHAPAKGATSFPGRCASSSLRISIHAPAKGATDSAHNLRFIHRISIHAPAKGATIRILWNLFQGRYFNPRSREGSDLQRSDGRGIRSRFQSTLPRRERLASSSVMPSNLTFQSTLPRRERLRLQHF